MKKKEKVAEVTAIYELVPKNGRASFNRKAKVIMAGGNRYLKSYDTVMGYIDKEGKHHKTSDYRSGTTNVHIKTFFGDSKAFYALPLEECPKFLVSL